MTPTKKDYKDVLKLCEDALKSCGDNFGSASQECEGIYEKYFDDKLVEKALKAIKKITEV